ncbi:MAG: PH domain-containing protein [Holophagaceae bacterium]|nr:PH domain-containing protein [Holophagaceae bacterium]
MSPAFDLSTVTRPLPRLWTYYVLQALMTGPLFPVTILVLYFRYHTLAYRFDDQGVSMSWGILFRREIHLAYPRIQDLHLMSNVVERWLGLAKLHVQTASGQAQAQMVLEGLPDIERVRDELFLRSHGGAPPPPAAAPSALGEELDALAVELRALREALAAERLRRG